MDKSGDRQNTVAAVAGCCELYDLQYGGAGNMNGVWQKKIFTCCQVNILDKEQYKIVWLVLVVVSALSVGGQIQTLTLFIA